MHGSGHRAEQTNSGMGSVPALLKTHVEMLAPVLMMYSTSRLASSPALPQPWCPTTWSTLEWWAKLLPKSCMNSAKSAWWKYCSKNWGGQGGTLRFLSQLGKLAQRACEMPAPRCSHSCGSLPAASWKTRPAKCWRSPKVPHSAPISFGSSYLGAGLAVVWQKPNVSSRHVVSLPNDGRRHPQVESRSLSMGLSWLCLLLGPGSADHVPLRREPMQATH